MFGFYQFLQPLSLFSQMPVCLPLTFPVIQDANIPTPFPTDPHLPTHLPLIALISSLVYILASFLQVLVWLSVVLLSCLTTQLSACKPFFPVLWTHSFNSTCLLLSEVWSTTCLGFTHFLLFIIINYVCFTPTKLQTGYKHNTALSPLKLIERTC